MDLMNKQRRKSADSAGNRSSHGWGPATMAGMYLFLVLFHLIRGGEHFATVYAVSAVFWAYLTGDYSFQYRNNRRRPTLAAAILFALFCVLSLAQYIVAVFS